MSRTTKNQHAFAVAYLETGKPSQSYRAAGYACGRMSDNAIAVQANRVLKNPNVALIIKQGREEARERCQVTIESLTAELEENRLSALTNGQAAAAVAATMAKAKLHGLEGGKRPEPKDSPGRQPDAPSRWAAVRAEIEAARRKRAREEAEPELGNGADGNGTAPTDTRHLAIGRPPGRR